MTTLELFKKHRKGEVSRDRFLYEVRRDSNLPWITNITSYDDAVKILKNKGIIRESEKDTFETDLLADLNKIMISQKSAEEVLEKAKKRAEELGTTIKDLYGSFARPLRANQMLSDVEPEQFKIKKGSLKEAQFEPQNIPTDPLVDRVNPYALKREVEKLLSKEVELTNDSYKQALNKAAKKLTTPEAVKKAMFSNADSVAKADANLQMTPVKKANHVDKNNGMKKIKGQETLKAQSAPTGENKKTKKPKGVEIMKDKGVEGKEKVIKENLLNELQSYLKKKIRINEMDRYEFTLHQEVDLPGGGKGKIIEMIAGTCVVELEDGTHKHLQLNVLNHAKNQAMEAEATKTEATDADIDTRSEYDPAHGESYNLKVGDTVEVAPPHRYQGLQGTVVSADSDRVEVKFSPDDIRQIGASDTVETFDAGQLDRISEHAIEDGLRVQYDNKIGTVVNVMDDAVEVQFDDGTRDVLNIEDLEIIEYPEGEDLEELDKKDAEAAAKTGVPLNISVRDRQGQNIARQSGATYTTYNPATPPKTGA